MSTDTLIASVCHLPRDFYSVGTKSVITLLREAGYFDHHDQVSVDAIRAYIAANPDVVNAWVNYAENKRTPSGWYLSDDGTVGYSPGGPVLRFDDVVTGCAEFIVRELAEIRRHAG